MDNYKNYIHLTAGRGPAECQWVIAQLYKRLIKEMNRNNITYKVIRINEGVNDNSYSSAILQIMQSSWPSELTPWIGPICWTGQSPYRPNYKRKNWFVEAKRLQKSSIPTLNIDQLSIITYRSSGPGGQHGNKVETAVRATCYRTGLTATATDHRSQRQNKVLAINRLKEQFNKLAEENLTIHTMAMWNQHLDIQRGQPVKRFKGFKFKPTK